jgi:hypothetical protein
MGIYVRKSVKAGPFRFTASRSGINVSAGVPGLRIGTGPRGNYVRVGRGSVSYSAVRASRQQNRLPGMPVPSLAPRPPVSGAVPMLDVLGASAETLEPSGSGDIVDQLNDAARRTRWGWIAAIAAFVVGLAMMPWGLILWAVAVPVCWWLFLRDGTRKNVVLLYDVDDAEAVWFDAVVADWTTIGQARKLWRTVRSGRVGTTYQHKTNGGASNLVQRIAATVSMQGPRHLATNVAVPTLTAGKDSLHFLPDRVLVRSGKRYSDVDYAQLRVRTGVTRFIERSGGVPADAQRVGQTWQYVNVKGGPDRRYKNNPVLPIVLYGEADLTSTHGLQWELQASSTSSLPHLDGAFLRRPAIHAAE